MLHRGFTRPVIHTERSILGVQVRQARRQKATRAVRRPTSRKSVTPSPSLISSPSKARRTGSPIKCNKSRFWEVGWFMMRGLPWKLDLLASMTEKLPIFRTLRHASPHTHYLSTLSDLSFAISRFLDRPRRRKGPHLIPRLLVLNSFQLDTICNKL